MFNFFKLWYFDDFYQTFFKKFLRFVRLVDNIINFYYKTVKCCLVLKKIFEKLHQFCNFQLLKKIC